MLVMILELTNQTEPFFIYQSFRSSNEFKYFGSSDYDLIVLGCSSVKDYSCVGLIYK